MGWFIFPPKFSGWKHQKYLSTTTTFNRQSPTPTPPNPTFERRCWLAKLIGPASVCNNKVQSNAKAATKALVQPVGEVVGKVGRCHNLRLLPPLKPFKGHRKKTIAGGDVGWKKWRNAPFFSTRGRKCRKRWTVQHVFKNVSEKIKRAGVFNIAKPGFCEVSWVSIKVGGWRQRWWWRQRAGREHFMIKISTNGWQMLVIYHSRTSRKKKGDPQATYQPLVGCVWRYFWQKDWKSQHFAKGYLILKSSQR